jgi:hypothetical protein
VLTRGAKYTFEIKSRTDKAQAAFNTKKELYTRKLYLNVIKKLVKHFIWNMAWHDAETWTLRTVDEKYLGSFK